MPYLATPNLLQPLLLCVDGLMLGGLRHRRDAALDRASAEALLWPALRRAC